MLDLVQSRVGAIEEGGKVLLNRRNGEANAHRGDEAMVVDDNGEIGESFADSFGDRCP